MRSIVLKLFVLLAGLAFQEGCSDQRVRGHVGQQYPSLRPTLLFDAESISVPATGMSYRTVWPATLARYEGGERIYYQEYFLDYQGIGHHNRDYGYRRFVTHREGYARR